MLKFAVAFVIIIALITLLACVNLNRNNKQKYFPWIMFAGIVGMFIILGTYIYYFH